MPRAGSRPIRAAASAGPAPASRCGHLPAGRQAACCPSPRPRTTRSVAGLPGSERGCARYRGSLRATASTITSTPRHGVRAQSRGPYGQREKARGRWRHQSRRSSLMAVFERVFWSTRLTITAQERCGAGCPFAIVAARQASSRRPRPNKAGPRRTSPRRSRGRRSSSTCRYRHPCRARLLRG